MEIIDGATFIGESVQLDDKHFIRCVFTDCILEYRGGEIVFDRTQLNGCRHVFFGRARRTLHYLQNVGLMQYQPGDWGEFGTEVH